MAADDTLVFMASDDGVYHAKLLDAAGQRLQFGIGDAPGVEGVGPEIADGDVLNLDFRLRFCNHDGPPNQTKKPAQKTWAGLNTPHRVLACETFFNYLNYITR